MSKLICDFCGATDTKDNPVITGDNACICKSCVNAAHDIMNGNIITENDKKDEELKDEPLHLQSLVNEVAKHNNPGSIEPCAESIAGMPKSSLHFA